MCPFSESFSDYNVSTLLPASAASSDFELDGTKLVKYTGPGGDVVIPDGVTTIAWNAFINNKNITSVTMPDSVTTLEMHAMYGPTAAGFANCTNLKSIRLSKSITKLSGIFYNCKSLESVVLPEGIGAIPDYMFYQCTSLKSVTIPDSVTLVRPGAFVGCTSLTEIIGGNGITTLQINQNDFKNVPWFEERTDDFILLGHCLIKYQGADRDVVIPDGVTEIHVNAFNDCDHVRSVTLPSSIAGMAAICTGWQKMLSTYGGLSTSYTGKIILPDSVVTVTFPTEGQLADDLAEMSWVDIASVFGSGGCMSIENLINCPNLEATDRIHNYLTGWINPGSYVYPQSERVTKLAQEITAGLTTDYEKAKAICSWVSQNMVYDYDTRNNHNTDRILDLMRGVCDDYSWLAASLCWAIGIPATIPATQVIGTEETNHAWKIIFADGRWFWADPTWEYFDCGSIFLTVWSRIPYSITRYVAVEDVPTDWAKPEVWEAICSYIVPLDLQSAYRTAITREDFCRLMTTLVETSTGTDVKSYVASKGLTITDPFEDTDSPEVLAAHALGIVNGTSDTTFNPNGSITRQEAAAMLARTGRLLGLTSGQGVSFTDAGKFASWAGSEIAFVSGLVDPVSSSRVMNGVSTNEFSPQGTYTREQAIMTALRLFHCAG